MELKVRTIPNSKTILIPIANENTNGVNTMDVNTIECKGKTYKVFDYYVYEKNETPQRSLMKLALGIDLDPIKIWAKYPNSDKIFLFICDEIEKVEEEVKKTSSVPSMYP
ncbi:MAG: hypothetical protein IMY67_11285 [Bacteroidetes bacterium]|nr:hypothetical protein [Bacteroidota bacterium]